MEAQLDTYICGTTMSFSTTDPMKDPNCADFCKESGAYSRVGDFDGDYRMDLCVPRPGDIHLALMNGDGFLVNRDFQLSDDDK